MATPPTVDADVALMVAVSAGDATAQRQLIERLLPRIRRLTGMLCRSASDADDAAQLAILEILQSASSFRVGLSLGAWTERIVVRSTLRLRRRERSRRNLLARWLLPGTLPWGTSLEQARADPVSLDTLLGQLSTEQRDAFVLHHALGYSVTEIAELTATAPGTIKSRLVTARKLLRQLLELEARRPRRGGER